MDVVYKDIKNIHLAVYPPTGRVRVSSPISTKKESLRLMVINKLSWIKKNIRKMESQVREQERKFVQRESHWFQGNRYLLNLIEEAPKNKVEIRNKKYLDLYTRSKNKPTKRKEILENFYREQLKQEIPEIISKWEKKLNVEVSDWGIRKMKTKWGSCNTDSKRIWVNLELAKKPVHCLDYIILHEMIHLIERHHNERFKALLDKHMPGWKSIKEELNSIVFEMG